MQKVPPFLMLDAWRGIAALWVVMTHASMDFLATGNNSHFLSSPLYALSIRGSLGVTMFFVISGYCIMGAAYSALVSGRRAESYWLDRIRRIYPPYLAACVLALVGGFLIGIAQSHHLSPPWHYHLLDSRASHQMLFWLTNLFLVQVEFGQPRLLLVAWSLCYEIVFYLIIGLLLAFAKVYARYFPNTTGMPVFEVGIGGLTYISLVWLILSQETCPFPLYLWYEFGLGALLFLVFAARTSFSTWKARGQLVLAGILTFVFAIMHESSTVNGGFLHPLVVEEPSICMQAATGLIFVGLLWSLRPFDAYLARHVVTRPLIWLGTISYSIYLVVCPANR